MVLLSFSPATCVIEIQAGGKTTNIGEWGQAKKLSLLKEDSLHLKANGLWLFPAPC